MRECALCPRDCRADRLSGKKGYCGETARIRAARAALHYWEEPCISGKEGSGAVFFCGCPLRCVFCQNSVIAAGQAGQDVSVEHLAEIFLRLQEEGANNINLVTPTHFVPQIAAALRLVKDGGLRIPVVYNTGSYEKAETLKMLDGLVDIYLPDLKYWSKELGKRYSNAPDYFETACAAIAEMVRQVPETAFEERKDGTALMKRGVIVRHLTLPGSSMDSRRVLRYLHETYGNRIYISIMNQYTPMRQFEDHPELNRRVSRKTYDRLVDFAIRIGIENGFIQEGGTAEESFVPLWDGTGL
ncbi:MAG TPA: radical SAM protein [Candidatus Eisenbergiella merdipullorum]|uniref:Radical SAM protein n=1 Tax=Candidatus Eisenbergiella merdipullorum TaxID=2838553 RepID=A0A9D2I734_9FIRM|nr:radical SAM protein [Candidatus Eisenbergiella merdipullorum]